MGKGQNHLKRLTFIISGLGLLATVVVGWLAMDVYRYAHQPASTDDTPITFTIASGESFDRLATRLKLEGFIRETLRFKLVARLRGNDKHLKAGEYRLSASMTPIQILDTLVSGEVNLHVITIPEGYTYKQIAQELERLGLADATLFMQTASDPEVVAGFGLEGRTMEGYLFPDTYYLPKGLDPRTIIAKMVERFHQQVPEAWYQRAKELGFSMLQIVTLAAMIEKETGDPSERPVISSVFHNRLKKKMRLESDPTVIYGINDFNGNLTRKHLSTYSDYNTYIIRGLPPGPIANPGRAAIEAALFPAKTDFLYFVSKKDKTHHFSTTIAEHNEAVRKYQLRHRRKNN
jgi:UPF0755 protein